MSEEQTYTNQQWQRKCAAELFNHVWELMEKPDRTDEESQAMIHAAHASRHHWSQVGTGRNTATGDWQIARVYSLLGLGAPALHYAEKCVAYSTSNDVEDWRLASAYEGLARAHFAAGNRAKADEVLAKATELAAKIEEAEERELIQSQIANAYTNKP